MNEQKKRCVDVAELRRLAVAAGGDEWVAESEADPTGFFGAVFGLDGDQVAHPFDRPGRQPDGVTANQVADFIAAACPATIIGLLDRVDVLENGLAAARQERDAAWQRHAMANELGNAARHDLMQLKRTK